MKSILAVVAHPDDEIIGPGGTLYKHVKNNDSVSVLILGDGKTSRLEKYQKLGPQKKQKSVSETSQALDTLGIKDFFKEDLPDNRFDSLQILDITKIVAMYIKKIAPQIVYTHHYGDLNIDHRRTSEAVVTAARPIENPCVEEIRMFETLSSTEMAGFKPDSVFLPNLFINIEDEIEKKLQAMSFYASELHSFPHPRSLETIKNIALLWGSKNNIKFAEAFYIFRSIKQTL